MSEMSSKQARGIISIISGRKLLLRMIERFREAWLDDERIGNR
jgi:hypothetical protein